MHQGENFISLYFPLFCLTVDMQEEMSVIETWAPVLHLVGHVSKPLRQQAPAEVSFPRYEIPYHWCSFVAYPSL